MHSKKLALAVLIALGLVAFGASFVLSRQFGVGPQAATGKTDAATEAGATKPEALDTPAGRDGQAAIEERHLMALIKEVRDKTRDVEKREQELRQEEQRTQMAYQDLRQEAEQLETLRAQMDSSVAAFKQAKTELERTRILIDTEEKANLKRTAGVYDRMSSQAAAGIIESMCENGQENDAVKIFQYMSERAVAKILAEVSDKKQAAHLSELMKRISEKG